MKIELPEVDWKSKGWSISSQVAKIMEEAGEVAEAIAEGDSANIIKEALDTAQTCFTLIDMVISQADFEYQIWTWEQLIVQHKAKLRAKGYLKED